MNMTNFKKAGAILAVVTVGALIFNSIAKRVPAVAKMRNTIGAGV